jgi:GNAT superfamily N-acetyltransferase
MFYRRARPNHASTERQRQRQNRADRRNLALTGTSDGVLVYDGDRAVGWCQFGPRGELPRIEQGRKYVTVPQVPPSRRLWRITCFFVDRPYRRKGVSRFALSAALEEIRRRGGGIVEAFPATRDNAVAMWFGTYSMFNDAGFSEVAPFGRSNLLMRRTVRSRRG